MEHRLVNFQFPTRFGQKQIRFNFDLSQGSHRFVLSFLQAGKFYESDVSNFLLQVLEPGDWAIDVGANLGYHSMLMGALVGPTGKVFAFEPADKTHQELITNCALNPDIKIEPIKTALADAKRESSFAYHTRDSGWSRVVLSAGTDPEMQLSTLTTETLDGVFKKATKPFKVLKIDTEGFEERILKGAEKLLEQNRLEFVIAEHHGGNLAAAGSSQFSLRDYMASKGFTCYVLGGGPVPVFPKFIPPGIEITSKWVCNLLFARVGFPERFYKKDDLSHFVSGPA